MNYVEKQKHSTYEHVQAKHFVEDMGVIRKNVWKDMWSEMAQGVRQSLMFEFERSRLAFIIFE